MTGNVNKTQPYYFSGTDWKDGFCDFLNIQTTRNENQSC